MPLFVFVALLLACLMSPCVKGRGRQSAPSVTNKAPPAKLNISDTILTPGLTDNHDTLYSCERFSSSFKIDPQSYFSFNTKEALHQLRRTGCPIVSKPRSNLDVELQPGQFLACGRNGVEAGAFELVAPYQQRCKRLVLTADFGAKDYLQPVPGQSDPGFPRADPELCHLAFIDDATAALLHLDDSMAVYNNWTIVRAKARHLPMIDPRENSRLYKHLAPRLFPHADWSLWVEPKVRVLTPAPTLVSEHMHLFGSFMALFAHHPRLGWFEEQKYAVTNKLVGPEVVIAQRAEYLKQGMTLTFTGLAEGSILMRDHRHPATHMVACNWWNEVLRFPPRDMTSLNFAHHALGFAPRVAPGEFQSIRKRGGLVLDRLWWNYVNPQLTSAAVHIAPRCRYNLHIGSQLFSRFQPVVHPNSTIHGLTEEHIEGVVQLRGGIHYRRFYLPVLNETDTNVRGGGQGGTSAAGGALLGRKSLGGRRRRRRA